MHSLLLTFSLILHYLYRYICCFNVFVYVYGQLSGIKKYYINIIMLFLLLIIIVSITLLLLILLLIYYVQPLLSPSKPGIYILLMHIFKLYNYTLIFRKSVLTLPMQVHLWYQ